MRETMIQQGLRAVETRVRAFFLLDPIGGVPSVAKTAAQREMFAAARRRMQSAGRLRRQGETVGALVLLREAALLLARATIGAEVEVAEPALGASAAMNQLGQSLDRLGLLPPAALERQRALISNGEPCTLDRLDLNLRERAADDLETMNDWLARRFEASSPEHIKVERAIRSGSVALIALALVGAAGARWAKRPNLALHREVRASSMAFSTTPSGAVDGVRYGVQLGFHSDTEDEPWLAIDLGRDYAIDRVNAFGRVDCCFDQSIPLAFEASDDGAVYRQVDKRETPFTQSEPWTFHPNGLVARFVRFRTLRRSVLVLSEVEVYGTTPPSSSR